MTNGRRAQRVRELLVAHDIMIVQGRSTYALGRFFDLFPPCANTAGFAVGPPR
jgi:hypothetical protein